MRPPRHASGVLVAIALALVLVSGFPAAATAATDRSDLGVDATAAGAGFWNDSLGQLQSRGPTSFGGMFLGNPFAAISDECARSLATGDVNGDGLPDLVVGCNLDDPGIVDSGAAFVYARAASNTGFEAPVELANPSPATGDQCGWSVAVGDVDGNGLDDVLVGCRHDDGPGTDSGRVAVYLSNGGTIPSFAAAIELAAPSPVASEKCGHSVAAGDVNGDGRDDVIAGCPIPAPATGPGRIVVFQRASDNLGFDAGYAIANPAPATDDQCGFSAAAGDLDMDGRDDVVMGCRMDDPGAVTNAGATYAFRRNATNDGFLAGVALPNPTPAIGNACGQSAATGDLNGDGRADVAMGCNNDDVLANFAGVAIAATWRADDTGFGSASELFDPDPSASDYCGQSVSVGDVNGDGRDDVAMGCWGDDTGANEAGNAVVFQRNGANSGFDTGTVILDPSPVSSDFCGTSLASADFDGDGRAEVAMGCNRDDTGATDAGNVVIRGGTTLVPEPITVDTMQRRFQAELNHSSPIGDDRCGTAVAGGDVDGDDRADVIIGCPLRDWGGGSAANKADRGEVIVRRRNATNVGFDPSESLQHPAGAAGDLCGTSVAAGDVNGDGLADVVAGCPSDDVSGTDNGSAVVYLRNGSNNGFLAGVVLAGPVAAAECGSSLAIADINGDGVGDVVVGCDKGDTGGTNAGHALVFVSNGGSPVSFAAAVTLVDATPAANEECGRSVAAGDVDGDGRADVVMGCRFDNGAASTAGVALAFRSVVGSPVAFAAPVQLSDPAAAAGDQCGAGVAVGDANGDGRGDVAIGCPGDDGGGADSGNVVTFRSTGGAPLTFAAAVVVSDPAAAAGDQCGAATATGDLDSDENVDLLVGCPGDSTSASGAGLGLVVRSTLTGWDPGQTIALPNAAAGDACGGGVAMADIHGDGRSDMVLGCMDDTGATDVGSAAIFTWHASLVVSDPGPGAADRCGDELAAGDVNGDGRGDVVLGCPSDDGAAADAGAVVVVTRDSTNAAFQVGVTLTDGAAAIGDACGSSVEVGDLNGDGRDDIVVGCPQDDTAGAAAGNVLVYLRNSGNTGFDVSVPLLGAAAAVGDACGTAVDVADVNGDGLGDVIVGCPSRDAAGADAGSAFVVQRSPGNGGFEAPVELVRAGGSAGDSCGTGVAAGDANADGRADVFVGCPGLDAGAADGGGVASFLRNAGNTAFDASTTMLDPAPGVGDACGEQLETGDVNGNGRVDVVTGCRLHDGGVPDGGNAVVFIRNISTGLFAGTALADSTPTANDQCGSDVGVGDLNADGRDDVLVGCPRDDAAGSDAGAVLLFGRSADNSNFAAAGDIRGSGAGATCGDAVLATDANADGRADVVAGCPTTDAGAADAGSALVAINQGTVRFMPTQAIVTRKLNRTAMTVASATLDVSVVRNGAEVAWDLSADGGATWAAATPGVQHVFATPGTDLRARARFDNSRYRVRTAVVHDLSVTYAADGNQAPSTPTLVSPVAGASLATGTPTLEATFLDPDAADQGTLRFQICTDPACAAAGDPAATGTSASGIANGANGTWTTPTLAAGTYYWRARGEDGGGLTGPWTVTRQLELTAASLSLSVDSASAAITPALLIAGMDGTATSVLTVTTTNAAGYSVSAIDQDDAWTFRHTNLVDTIADWTGTPGSPSPWPEATAGYGGLTVLTAGTGKDAVRWGAGVTATDYASLNYVGLDNSTGTLLHSHSAAVPGGDQVTVSYRVNPSLSQQAGSYNAGVAYTAVANP